MKYFIVYPLSLGIVLLTIIPIDKRCCNALNEISSYTFRYSVDAAPVLSQHWEERRGDIVHGSYSFLDPAGKIRIVEYQVNGQGGFRAVVRYRLPPSFPLIGHLKYPKSHRVPIRLVQPVGFISDGVVV